MKSPWNLSRFSVVQLQVLLWLGVTLAIYASRVVEDSLAAGLSITFINVIYYAAIIYGNILWLYPRFYQTGKWIRYILYSIVYVVVIALARGYFAVWVYNHFIKVPEVIGLDSIFTFLASGFLNYLMSLVFRIALAYFTLKRQSEEVLLQKSRAELNLLKAQLQPHFLFNTLNNIYYEIYTEAPRSAKLIEQLSDIMRYFVDECPKEQVTLSSEIAFLENYVALESIRLRYRADIRFEKQLSKDFMIPPMLLMTLAENIFKHGIDKDKTSNPVTLKLYDRDGHLYFETINPIVNNGKTTGGLGLKNLHERLQILYGDRFELIRRPENNFYYATLKLPVQ